MNFLYPLFLAGAFAIVLPIVFHLIRRSTKTKVPFSTLRFLQPSPPRLTKKSRLENLWLLLLRCLILILLALAFARPYIEEALDQPNAAENPQRNIILVDASASMRRGDAWDQAQSLLADEINAIDPTALAAAYTFDNQLHPIVTFEQWNRSATADRSIQVISRAKDKKPTWKATHLGNALTTAVDLLEESTRIGEHDKDTQDWRIVVIGDLQKGMLLDGIQGYEWPKGCTVTFRSVALKETSNAAIHSVPSVGAYASLVDNEGARIRVSNANDSVTESFRYGWIRGTNDRQLAAESEIYLPPGKSRVINAPEAPEGLLPDVLRIEGDEHDFDNTAWRVPLRARESKVLYFGGADTSDSTQLLFYLHKAFQQTKRHVVTVVPLPPDQPVLDELLTDARLIVIGAPLNDQVVNQLEGAVQAGSTILIPLHSPALQETLQSLTSDRGITVQQSPSQRYGLFGELDFQHPIFSSFADPRFSDFSKIRFWNFHELDLGDNENANVIARFDEGSPAVTELKIGKGSLFVTSYGWQPKQSQFALSTKFVPFLYALLDFGAGVHEVKSHYFVGQEVDLSSVTDASAISIELPNGETIELADQRTFTQTLEPGIYSIDTGETPIRFAVNLHPGESETSPILEETLIGLGIPTGENQEQGEASPIVVEAQRKLKAAELESNQKFWQWLVIAALIIASMETLIAGIVDRRRTVSPA